MEQKTKSVTNNFLLGFSLGLLVPFLTFIFFNAEVYRHLSMEEFFDMLRQKHLLSALLSLCAVPNLGLFFLFMWKNNYKSGKGVIGATIIMVILVFSFKFVL